MVSSICLNDNKFVVKLIITFVLYGTSETCLFEFTERYLALFSTVITSTEREAASMIEGILHNETIQSTSHSTDTHGFTEAIFAVMGLLDNDFSPRIKGVSRQKLHGLVSVNSYSNNIIKPHSKVKKDKILKNWDSILRLMASLKSKTANASVVFKRLNSYSAHPLYAALKELGKLYKTRFIIKYFESLEYRQSIEKQLNISENSNKLSKVLSFGNNQELAGGTTEEMEIIEGCKRLIKNCIVCWNYLYFSELLLKMNSKEKQLLLIKDIQASSMMKWKHINLHGTYDFTKKNNSSNLIVNLRDIKQLQISKILKESSIISGD